jgi:lysylphosphatidylglycerol synthetase-like protein (DUF2156 family)
MALPAFSTAMAMTAVQLGIVLSPIVVYGAVRRSKEIWVASMLTLTLGFVVAAILFTPNFGWLANLQYNWLQKSLACLCVLLLPSLFGFIKSACGFSLPKGGAAFAIGMLIGLFFAVLDFLMAAEHSIPKFETMLFELTMPGLQEEPLYRGLMLCIWDKCLGRPWRLFGVQFGAGCLITTALFTVGHLVALDRNWHLVLNPDLREWVNFALFCLAMCWLRYKFDSVWPGVLAHNADNGIFFALSNWAVHLHGGA